MSSLVILVVIASLAFSTRARWMPGQTPGNDASLAEHASYMAAYMLRHAVTREALDSALLTLPAADAAPVKSRRAPGEIAVRLFTLLGGIFVLGGLAAYISMFWATLPAFMRVLVTLGFGLGLTVLSVLAMREGRFPRLVTPLILIAALLESIGWFVLLQEYFPHVTDGRKVLLVAFSVMALQQISLYVGFRRTSLLAAAMFFFCGAFAAGLDLLGADDAVTAILLGATLTGAGVALTRLPHAPLAACAFAAGALSTTFGLYDYLGRHWDESCAALVAGAILFCMATGLRLPARQTQAGISPSARQALLLAGLALGAIGFNAGVWQLVADRVGTASADLAAGVSLCLAAYGLANERSEAERRLAGLFYLAGSAIAYGGLFTLVQHTAFELLYLAAAIGMMYAHILLESRAILLTSTLAILGFIGYYTSEHFLHSVGWPVSLMLVGVAFLATGAWSLRIARRAAGHAA